MKKNNRRNDFSRARTKSRRKTCWMWDKSLFLIVCGWILTPFIAALMVFSWFAFCLWVSGRNTQVALEYCFLVFCLTLSLVITMFFTWGLIKLAQVALKNISE